MNFKLDYKIEEKIKIGFGIDDTYNLYSDCGLILKIN